MSAAVRRVMRERRGYAVWGARDAREGMLDSGRGRLGGEGQTVEWAETG